MTARFQSVHLCVRGFTRNGNRRHAVVVFHDGDPWAAEDRPEGNPEATARLLVAGEGQPAEGKPWSLDHLGDIYTTASELRRLVGFAHKRQEARHYFNAGAVAAVATLDALWQDNTLQPIMADAYAYTPDDLLRMADDINAARRACLPHEWERFLERIGATPCPA
jgi:hypothetical protein